MTTVQEKLAESLRELQRLQNANGFAVVKSSDLSRVHLQRLVKGGFLQEVMKGWYISSRPGSAPGDTTNWYTSYWYFISQYASSRFGKEWCLSPDQSLSIYSGNRTVPEQVIIRITKSQSASVNLLHDTSVFYFQATLANPINTAVPFNLNLYSLPEALIECGPYLFKTDPVTVRTCLTLLQDTSDVLRILLEKGQSKKAGRLAGAFRNIGNVAAADEIVDVMKSLGYDVREEDPFEDKATIVYTRATSPYVARLRLMWNTMREIVVANLPKSDQVHSDIEACMKTIEAQYMLDAYHSLSIEGYSVTDQLIEKVRRGDWSPDTDITDSEQRNAMAARGYWIAFQDVKNSIRSILEEKNPAEVVENDFRTWYRGLFTPSIAAGLLNASDLAGFRTHQVYIRGSKHTPLNPDAVRDAMPVLFDLLKNESEASVRAVLGHFMFVYIHPFMDGNGRVARFLMNAMLISGGYDWTIIPVERRNEYMAALEKASVSQDITDFARFLTSLVAKKIVSE